MSIGYIVKSNLISEAHSLRAKNEREAASMLESFADQVDAISKVAREKNNLQLMSEVVSSSFDLISKTQTPETLRVAASTLDAMFARLS